MKRATKHFCYSPKAVNCVKKFSTTGNNEKSKAHLIDGLFYRVPGGTIAAVAFGTVETTLLTLFTLIADLPPCAVGITAQGRITKDDYEETPLPALKKAAAEWKGLNFLFVMETDFAHFTLGAWLAGLKVNAQYFMKWNKVAVVSEKDGLDLTTKAFSLIAPGETKIFSLAELSAAHKWISTP